MMAPAEAVIPYDPSGMGVRADAQVDWMASIKQGPMGHRLDGRPLDTEGEAVIVSFSPPARRHEIRAVARESLLEN